MGNHILLYHKRSLSHWDLRSGCTIAPPIPSLDCRLRSQRLVESQQRLLFIHLIAVCTLQEIVGGAYPTNVLFKLALRFEATAEKKKGKARNDCFALYDFNMLSYY